MPAPYYIKCNVQPTYDLGTQEYFCSRSNGAAELTEQQIIDEYGAGAQTSGLALTPEEAHQLGALILVLCFAAWSGRTLFRMIVVNIPFMNNL